MVFEKVEFQPDGDCRFKVVMDNKKYFVDITQEAWEDDFPDGLTEEKQSVLKKAVKNRIAENAYVESRDSVGASLYVILIKSGELY